MAAAEAPPSPAASEVQGYCVRCKKRRTIQEAQVSRLSTGAPAHRGRCGTCQSIVFRLIRDRK